MKKSVIILILALALFSALASALEIRLPTCSDYCSNSVSYHDGKFSVSSGKCEYATTGCRYGCDGTKCASAPEVPTRTVPETPTEQLSVRERCPDFCKNDVFQYGGVYNPLTGICDYTYRAKCAAGCNMEGTECAAIRELDTDKDGVHDSKDNCRDVANKDQKDSDYDGIGDACDKCPNDFTNDKDYDKICEDKDNCPGLPNPDQKDTNKDGQGDLCDCDDKTKADNEEYIDCGGHCPSCDPCLMEVLPSKFDWRNFKGKSWMTPVKDQATCGSCWAFGSVGAVEARFNIENNNTIAIDLSEQQLVSDCGCPGSCLGGFPEHALNFIQNNGIVTESCFPYTSQHCIYKNTRFRGGSEYLCENACKNKKCSNPGTCDLCESAQNQLWYIQTHGTVANDIDTIKRALVCKGPLAVTSKKWSHVIVLVGWDDSDGTWAIKNSWGIGWKNKGYGRIYYEGHDYSDIRKEVHWVWGVHSPAYTQLKSELSKVIDIT